MMPSLLLAATIIAPGAPIPKETSSNPVGPAPRVLAVKANAAGSITIMALIQEKRKVMVSYVTNENGKQVVKQQEQEITTTNVIQKEFTDFGGKFAIADGSPLTPEQAVRRVKDGATVLVAPDGKPVDRGWLKAVSGDTVIMLTDELAKAQIQYGHSGLPTTAPPRLAMLSSDDKGAIRLAVNAHPTNFGQNFDDFGWQNGGAPIIRAGRVMVVNGQVIQLDTESIALPGAKPADSDGKKPLDDIRFDAYDTSGGRIPKAAAIKRLKAGGLVLFASDNRVPDHEYLRAFHEDVIVLVSPELMFPFGQPNPYDYSPDKQLEATKPARGAALPLIPPPGVPAVPAIRLIPAQGVPAGAVRPAAPAKPAPAPPAKPVEKAKENENKAEEKKGDAEKRP